MNTKHIGQLTEAVLVAALLSAGYTVLLPWGDNARYDLVIERNGQFQRVQCKTGRYLNGVVCFATCSSYAHRGRKTKDYRNTADLFGVYCPQLQAAYLVPVSHVGTKEARLRVTATKSNQSRKVRWASQYRLSCGVA